MTTNLEDLIVEIADKLISYTPDDPEDPYKLTSVNKAVGAAVAEADGPGVALTDGVGLDVAGAEGVGLPIGIGDEAAMVAAGAVVHYMQRTKQGGVEHLDGVRYYERSGCLELDAVSVRNLELVEPLFSGETVQTTLFYTMDACCTPPHSPTRRCSHWCRCSR